MRFEALSRTAKTILGVHIMNCIHFVSSASDALLLHPLSRSNRSIVKKYSVSFDPFG
jgi:hypothetical protein